jgi:hypothetical protein
VSIWLCRLKRSHVHIHISFFLIICSIDAVFKAECTLNRFVLQNWVHNQHKQSCSNIPTRFVQAKHAYDWMLNATSKYKFMHKKIPKSEFWNSIPSLFLYDLLSRLLITDKHRRSPTRPNRVQLIVQLQCLILFFCLFLFSFKTSITNFKDIIQYLLVKYSNCMSEFEINYYSQYITNNISHWISSIQNSTFTIIIFFYISDFLTKNVETLSFESKSQKKFLKNV